jgi:hypothetical protein
MTLRIETRGAAGCQVLRLIGQIQAQHLEDLKTRMETDESTPRLDLEEVTLVDVEVVRFLGGCEARGTELVHVPPYIRAWIRTETAREMRS